MGNIIKQNSYLILGLYASSNPREINKRGKEILRRLHIGDVPEYDADVGIFSNFRNEENTKNAIQRLSMPKKKIVDALFWFDIVNDDDLNAINADDHNTAIDIWGQYINKETPKALLHVKNLAVLYTILLYTNEGSKYIEDSIKMWKSLFDKEKFWKSFFNSFKLHHEVDISDSLLEDLRKEAPALLADIYTELSALHNESNFINLFQNNFHTKGKKIENEILNPIYESIDKSVKKLEGMDISSDGVFDDDESKELRDNIESIQSQLNKAIEAGLYDDSKVKRMRDRASDAIRTIVLDLHNNLSEYDKAHKLLMVASKICGTNSMKQKLDEEIKQLKKNLEEAKDHKFEFDVPAGWGTVRTFKVNSNFIYYGKQKIKIMDAQNFSFHFTKHSINGIPTSSDYNLTVGDSGEDIKIRFTSSAYSKTKQELFFKILGIVQYLVEPVIVNNILNNIFSKKEIINIGNLEFNVEGISRKKMFGKIELLPWKEIKYVPQLSRGMVDIYKTDKNGKAKIFHSVSMGANNAVIIPKLIETYFTRSYE